MFVEKKYHWIEDSVERAHRQAFAMAEKRIKSEFNEMMFAIKRIISKKNIEF